MNTRRYKFEQYWDDVTLGHVGSNGAVHWNEFATRASSLGNNPKQLHVDDSRDNDAMVDTLEAELLANVTSIDEARMWSNVEELRTEYQWRPWQAIEEPADLDRLVVFADITPSLVDLPSLECRFRLVVAFLKCLGCSMPDYARYICTESGFRYCFRRS